MAEEETTKQKFDKEFKALLKQSRDIIMAKDGFSISLGKSNAIMNCLTKYEQVYKHTEPDEHYDYFINLYRRNRLVALNILQNDKWLVDGSHIIQYGEGVTGVSKQNRIMLTAIYRKAVELRDAAEKRLDEMAALGGETTEEPDLNRPEIILLHLYRILALLIEGEDKSKLCSIVDQLEVRLQIKEGESAPQSSGNGGLGGLFDIATNMLGKMGIQTPQGMPPPNEQEFGNVLNTVFNNPQTQTTITSIFAKMQGCTDINQAVTTMLGELNNKELTEAITGSISTTANTAISQALPNGPSSSSSSFPQM